MKNKELKTLTTEELKSKVKTMTGVLIIMSSLVILYSIFFIYKLATGTWETNTTLGTIMLGMLVIVISSTTVSYTNVAKILKQRKEEK